MGKGDYLGEFEQIVMLAVLRLGKNAYGVTIWEEIEKRTGRSAMMGAVYATLDRLESKSYIVSKVGAPTAERGGRAKRFFKITAHGAKALDRSRKILVRMWAGLDPVLGEP
jgi:PadR family transcriptional regulator PadR